MKQKITFLLLSLYLLTLAGCWKNDSFQIKIISPADSTEEFVYSTEEISPIGDVITVSCGENLGDTEVVLKPVEAKGDIVYQPTYLTPGMPVKLEVEQGAWYQIGVSSIKNASGTDVEVYVEVEGVEVRIS